MENTNCFNFGGQDSMLEDTAGRNMTANPYDGNSPYKKGAICIQNNKLYEANQNIDVVEQFTESHWTETTLCDIVSKNKSDIGELTEKLPNPVLLWENPDPTQRFPVNGTIELSSNDYNWLEIYYTSSTTSSVHSYQKVKKGNSVNLVHVHYTSSGIGFGNRTLTYVDDTHLKSSDVSIRGYFSGSTFKSDTAATAYAIPVKIYGIK